MSLILSLVAEPRRYRVRLALDDGRELLVHDDVAARAGLSAGRDIPAADLDAAVAASALRFALDAAAHFLKARPRSEAELKQRLRRLGHSADTVDQVLEKLREKGLISDATFAGFWAENREAFNPRSKRLVQSELVGKGVSRSVAQEMTETIDDDAGAWDAALKKQRSLAGLDFETFRRRLDGYLQRRGFDFEVVRRTVKRAWEEFGSSR